MFTSPFANKYFDFNAQVIELPMIHPMTDVTTTTTQQEEDENKDITMTEPAISAPADNHGVQFFMDVDQESSLWKAARTLLDLHHAATHHHQSDNSPSTTHSPSSMDSSSDSQKEPTESSTSSSNSSSRSNSSSSSSSSSHVGPRTRQRRPQQQQQLQQQQQQQRHKPITNTTTTTTTTSGTIAKPRWSDEERNRLLLAVVEEKSLDQLTTFDWKRIAGNVRNQTSTSCRERWLNHSLPAIHQLYQPNIRSPSSSSATSPLSSTSSSE